MISPPLQEVTGSSVEIVWVDQGYTGEEAQVTANGHGIELKIVRLPDCKKGFVLLPRRKNFSTPLDC